MFFIKIHVSAPKKKPFHKTTEIFYYLFLRKILTSVLHSFYVTNCERCLIMNTPAPNSKKGVPNFYSNMKKNVFVLCIRTKFKNNMTLFFWPEHFPPPPGGMYPKTKISQKQKISLEKSPWICTKKSQKPKVYVPQICQKTKVIHLRLRYTAPETGGCDLSVNRFLQVYLCFVAWQPSPSSQRGIVLKHFSFYVWILFDFYC